MTKKEIIKLELLKKDYLDAVAIFTEHEVLCRKEGKDIASVRTARMCYNKFIIELDGLLKGKE